MFEAGSVAPRRGTWLIRPANSALGGGRKDATEAIAVGISDDDGVFGLVVSDHGAGDGELVGVGGEAQVVRSARILEEPIDRLELWWKLFLCWSACLPCWINVYVFASTCLPWRE